LKANDLDGLHLIQTDHLPFEYGHQYYFIDVLSHPIHTKWIDDAQNENFVASRLEFFVLHGRKKLPPRSKDFGT